ncbi:MAG: ketoacyl-ACP synthase III [Pseudomonadota bacterium]
MTAKIQAIEYYLPEAVLTNDQLTTAYPDWSVEKIGKKTGVYARHIAGEKECASDLAVKAARKLIHATGISADRIEYLLFCTQSPDYYLPTSACLIQDRLGLGTHVGALDFNLGCSGYIYGLSIAKGLVESGQAHTILLLTAETYSKYIHPEDRSVRTIFGDAATATLIVGEDDNERESESAIGPFVFGTDGAGAENLIVPVGGQRYPDLASYLDANPSSQCAEIPGNYLCMNGSAIFNFTLQVVPRCLDQLLKKCGKEMGEIDRFIFHQANKFMLEHLRQKLKIPKEKYYLNIADFGNTVSCSIPIALRQAQMDRWLRPGHLVMLVGFGVGYSWGGTLVRLAS